MEGHSTSSSDSCKVTAGVGNGGGGGRGGGGASSFLANLPSRGLFTSTILSCNPVLSCPNLFLFRDGYLLIRMVV